MKVLLCCHLPLSRSLGGAKVFVELADALRGVGCTVDLIGPDEYAPQAATDTQLADGLRAYLRRHASAYDVVDYNHEHLPYPRTDFAPGPLFVARSVLLAQHLDQIAIPKPRTLRAVAGSVVYGRRRAAEKAARIARAQKTVEQADLVMVSNRADVAELSRRHVPAEKIALLPFGLSGKRLAALGRVRPGHLAAPVVAFVGTFDYRKGALDFPAIVSRVHRAVPAARFRLVGTRGLFQTEAEVRAHFPAHAQALLDVRPTYKPDDLPALMDGACVGLFPSRMEGFPFGVMEMLAAGLPVVAYDAPGPPEMLPPEWLVPPGDAEALADVLVGWLQDAPAWQIARTWARHRAGEFTWARIARETCDAYAARAARWADESLNVERPGTVSHVHEAHL